MDPPRAADPPRGVDLRRAVEPPRAADRRLARQTVIAELRSWADEIARASSPPGEGGVLAIGMRADIVILSLDPTTASVTSSWTSQDVRVDAVVVGGVVVEGALEPAANVAPDADQSRPA